ncbi:MAG: hypothetical protein COS99_06450 [Candidatus Omnitrophica bacterium CG07_land_8_20_14_0_80_42_15]|uniref:M23ase beta-sheet core domain-containing protein n=1 Tax=Candidatus Aquitaenariimonas noxiae TaxID=1974741 RepID=A0A2J0KXU6_9BACT|nr:MAG: hypothetical protein COS99_06450 [Candidatus Omnitrophica bacterium CG07_land_8_20_14_0_80_42_15]
MRFLKTLKFLIVTILCFIIVNTCLLSYRPLYIKWYKWKEPYFIMPISIKNKDPELRGDIWGEGYFGAKRRGGRRHRGIDILADIGTPVHAAKSGRAICYYQPRGMGKYVKIVHPDGIRTIYGHLDGWLIKSDVFVRQGQTIGLVGKSGNASVRGMQPHLHFEIVDAGKAVDPLNGYIKQ